MTERERDFRPAYSDRPATHPNSIPNDEVSRESIMHSLGKALTEPAPGACAECGDTKIGDDGYECKSCPKCSACGGIDETCSVCNPIDEPALVRNVDYIDRFGDEAPGDVYDPEDDPFRE